MEKKQVKALLKVEMAQYNDTRAEYQKLKLVSKLVDKLPYKDMNIRITENGFINKGDIMEYITAWHYFGIDNYVLDSKEYDIHLNGKYYEIKSVVINDSTPVKHLVDILVVGQITKNGLQWYEIPLKENSSLVGLKISNKILKNLKQYKK